MSPYRFSFIVGASLLLASCADEFPGSKNIGDGSIAFSVDRAAEAVFSRAGGDDTPVLSFHKTLQLDAVEKQNLWLHVESAVNPAIYRGPITRGKPVTTGDMNQFKVTALLPDGNAFMQTQTVTKNATTNLWQTEETYFWPENDALTFQCQPTSLPSSLTNLTADGTKFTFDYETPVSEDGVSDAVAQKDFVLATHTYSKSDAQNGTVNILFRHPLAGICFVQDESLVKDEDGKDGIKIKKLELIGLNSKGSCEFDSHNPISNSKIISKWSGLSTPTPYTQEIGNSLVDVPINSTKTEKAIAEPFMVIPHTKDQLTDFAVKVTIESKVNGEVKTEERTISLTKAFDDDGLLPGRIYVLTFSGLDSKYPPVNNLKGMAGGNRISLTWENPDPTYEWNKQCGVTITVIQKGTDEDGKAIQSAELVTTRYWKDSDKNTDNSLFPNSKDDLDLFAYITEGIDKDGNVVKIDTKTYDEFECHVYADYYNTEEDSYKNGQPVIHHSVETPVNIKPEKNEDLVLFYIPEGAGTPDGLLDDDDVAAWAWFKKTYPKGKYVTKDGYKDDKGNTTSLDELREEGYVIWVPCGVQLRGGENFEYLTSLPATETKTPIEIAEERIEKVNNLLFTEDKDGELKLSLPEYLTKQGLSYYKQYIGYNPGDEVSEYFKDNETPAGLLKKGARVPGAYNYWKTGEIKLTDPTKYFTDKDIKAIRDFYAAGGNLLLTTFSIELVQEFGVIPYNCWRSGNAINEFRPFFHLFNEVKPSSIWFVRSEFDEHKAGDRNNDNHPLYKGMFKCGGDLFPESVEYKGVGEEEGKDILDPYQGDDSKKGYIYVGSDRDRTVQMYPLLSMGADACENNNVVWDFNEGHQANKTMDIMEKDCNGRFLGTWGQISDQSVGVIFEFYPGKKDAEVTKEQFDNLTDEERALTHDWINKAYANHGRCIAIGLGAYEFNNGLKYDPSVGVKNYYQSNVEKMTANAINYLMTAPKDKTAPPFD